MNIKIQNNNTFYTNKKCTYNRLTDIQNCDIATLLISQIKPISELAYYIWNGILMSFNHCTWVLLIWWEQCLQCLLGKAIKVVCNYDFAHTVLLHMQQERKWSWLRRRTFWEGYLYFYPPMRNYPLSLLKEIWGVYLYFFLFICS